MTLEPVPTRQHGAHPLGRVTAAYEVTFLAGYTEPAPFFRAFTPWTRKTPQQYRASVA